MALVLILLFGTGRSIGASWPSVVPMVRTIRVPDARHPKVELRLRGLNGEDLYELECRNWLYELDKDFSYSGDFECRLAPLKQTTSFSTLFAEHPDTRSDWETRARFFVAELVGSCGAFVDYGRIRTFRLRGMRLVLEISDPQFVTSRENALQGPLALKSFDLIVRVSADPEAESEIAAPSAAPYPPSACGQSFRSAK